MKLNPANFNRDLLAELVQAKVLAWYRDREKGDYLGLTPTARREILQLKQPRGLAALAYYPPGRQGRPRRVNP